ncbi:hypothetical protein [Nocardia sp. IFM 10818]
MLHPRLPRPRHRRRTRPRLRLRTPNDYGYARPVCALCQNTFFAQLTAWYWDII